jgi:hypothetical protein
MLDLVTSQTFQGTFMPNPYAPPSRSSIWCLVKFEGANDRVYSITGPRVRGAWRWGDIGISAIAATEAEARMLMQTVMETKFRKVTLP